MFNFIFLASLIIIWFLLHLILRSAPLDKPILIGHRGLASSAPENTIEGVKYAIENGIPYVEIDIQRSADGVLLLLHDTTVNRTTNGKGKIGQLNWEYIKSLDAGIQHSRNFKNVRIPDFDSVLSYVSQTEGNLVIEAKNPALYPGIENQILKDLHKYGMHDRVILISFNHNWLAN